MIKCAFKEQWQQDHWSDGWIVPSGAAGTNDTKLLIAYDDTPPGGWKPIHKNIAPPRDTLALVWVDTRHVRIKRSRIPLFDSVPAPDGAKVPADVTATVKFGTPFATPIV